MITNQFSAEFGRGTGSVVAVATKSGTNTPHGSLHWFHNSNPLNSLSNVDKSSGATKAPFRIENQFGGTIGGPIKRDRTFFFGSLQRWTDRQLGAGATISSAPTEAGRSILQANGGSRITTWGFSRICLWRKVRRPARFDIALIRFVDRSHGASGSNSDAGWPVYLRVSTGERTDRGC
jgi:hypothetical protein